MRKAIIITISFLILTGAIFFGIKIFIQDDNPEINNNNNNGSGNPVEEKKLKIVDLDSNTRPLAVMINNHPVARPLQSGLQDAYLVYEIIVEGGFTRLMALYKDQNTARIGSLRSARYYFADYALENDAIYFHYQGSLTSYSNMTKYPMDALDFGINAQSWRDKTLNVATEHTAFTSMEKLNDSITKKKLRSTTDKELLFNYSIDPIKLRDDKEEANDVIIEYSSNSEVEYNYNSTTKLYERSFNGVKNIDYVTKKTIHH